MILIVGATGDLGGRIATSLIERGEDVRVLLRPGAPAPAAEWRAAGAEVVSGDLKNADSLAAACSEVDGVITTANATARSAPDTIETVDRRGNVDLVNAAEHAGVRRFLFLSALGADPAHPMPLLRAKGEVEQRLRETDLAWTVLQPNVFMDKLIPIVVGAPALAGSPVDLVGVGGRRHSFVSVSDVVAYAVAALHRPESVKETLVIGGPESVSWLDIVAAFEDELGHPIPVRTTPPGMPVPGQPLFVTELLTALDSYDSPIDMHALQAAYGVTPCPMGDYVRGFLSSVEKPVIG